jgi:amino acid permease
MKKRNLLSICVWAVLTFGIYMLVWLSDTRKGIIKILNDPKAIPSLWLLFSPLVVLFAALGLVLLAGDNAGARIVSILLGTLAVPALLIGPCWFIYKYSKALHRITQDTDPVMLLVFYILLTSTGLGFIWMVLIQSDINKYLERFGGQSAPTGGATPQPPSPPAPTPNPPQWQPPAQPPTPPQGPPPQAPGPSGPQVI